MSQGKTVVSGNFEIELPSWGRSFWQDPNDGVLFLAYASGATQVNFVTSADSGVTWSAPKHAFFVDEFDTHPNFDIAMDNNGDLHCGFRYLNQNCYAHLTKSGVTWNQEAPFQRPWSTCADSGIVGGHNGSVYVHEINDFYTANGTDFTPAGFRATPQVFLVAKCEKDGGGLTAIKAARVLSPFTSAPASGYFTTDVSAITTGIPPGLDGGFPIFTAAGKPADFGGGTLAYQKQVTYSVDRTGILVTYNDEFDTFSRAWIFRNVMTLFAEGDAVTTNISSSGLRADVIQGPSMGFEKSPYPFDPVNAILVSTNEEDITSFFDKHWDMFSTAHEHANDESFGIDQFFRVESSASVQGAGTQNRSLNYDEWADDVFGGGQPSNVAPALAPFSGTLCDITNGAQSGIMYMYFNSRGSDGRHCVSRILCEVEPQPQTPTPTASNATTYRFSSRFHPISGVRNFAYVDTTLAGGDGGKAMWKGMRALHHVHGQWAAGKSEFVATTSSGLAPRLNRLITWDFNKSLEAQFPLTLPTFAFDHIAASGTNTTFLGLSFASIASSPSTVHNLFDQDTTTSGVISNGDSLTFEWNTPVIITRIEIPWNKTDFSNGVTGRFFEVRVEVSQDGVTFDTIKLYDGDAGRIGGLGDKLVKLFAEHDLTTNTFAFDTRMDAGVGSFLRITFEGAETGTRDVREVRIYGAATTAGKVTTEFNSFARTFSRPRVKTEDVERFDGVFEFTSTPPGWRTSGDWEWFVQASGELSKRNKLPTAVPTRNGIVRSGIFAGLPVGSGDGSALTTAEWMPRGTSGIVEVDINVGVDELDEDGNPGRTVEWATRYHKIGQGLMIPAGPEDDEFQFFVAPSGAAASLNMGEIKDFHVQGNCFANTCDYFKVKTNIEPGPSTLRWVFRRGTSINTIPILGDQSLAYIDNVKGLDAPPQPSILGYLSAESFATGVIHGFLPKANWSAVNVYTKGYYWFEPVHGYLGGAPNACSHIHAYMLGNTEGQVLGYMLGGSGLLSIPSGAINGYIAVQSGTMSRIHGYALAPQAEQILGYLTASSGFAPASGIFGFMLVPDEESVIFGGVNMGVSGTVDDSVLGFLNNAQNEEIFGFVLGPSGTTTSVNAYLPPQKSSTILGYIASLASQTGSVYSYVSVADEESDIFGYMSASGDPIVGSTKQINGYLLNDGVAETIFGYMNVIDTSIINGYMKGAEFASGAINSYISGVGFAQQQVQGYLAGISGTASGAINSYLVGVELPSQSVFGWIVGVPDAADSCEACTPDHGSVPVPPAVQALTLPSSCFNI